MVWLKRESFQPPVPRAGDDTEPAGRLVVVPPPAPSAPLAHTSEVLEKLRCLIAEGLFPPGSKLPAERALALQFSVGRPSLREAIKALNVMGVLESRHGSGTFVKCADSASTSALADMAAGATPGVRDIFEVRKMFEPRAAWLAATRASESDLAEIEEARRKLEEHEQDWRLVTKLDMELHSAIVRAAQNPVLNLVHQTLAVHIFAGRSPAARFVPAVARMRKEHTAVVEAILTHQADTAEKAMLEHLNADSLELVSKAGRP